MNTEDESEEVRQVETMRPGKVVIYACESDSSVAQALRSHEACIAEFGKWTILASHDMDQLPVVPEAYISEFTLGEADCIASDLRKSCFVFVTKDVKSRPDYGFILKLDDWRKIIRKQVAMTSRSLGTDRIEREYFAAVLIDLRQQPTFKAVSVNADAIASWENVLLNCGSWLRDVWSISGTWIKQPELKLRSLEGDQEFVPHTDHVFDFGSEFRAQLMICHLFKFWKSTHDPYKQMSWKLSQTLGLDDPFSQQRMHSLLASATCINPPPETAKDSYGTLRNAIRRSYRPAAPSTHRLDPKNLCWLLAVKFPVEFAAQLEAGRTIADLTASTGKKVQVELPIIKSR